MGRPERPLDRDAGPLEAFAADLRELRNAAGKVSYRALADRAGFSPSVLSAATSGFSLPTLRVTLGLVTACGGDPQEWTRRWHAVARELRSGEHGAGNRPRSGAAVPAGPARGAAGAAGGPGGWPVTVPASGPGAGLGGWPAGGSGAGPGGWSAGGSGVGSGGWPVSGSGGVPGGWPAGMPPHGPDAGPRGWPEGGAGEWFAWVPVGEPGEWPGAGPAGWPGPDPREWSGSDPAGDAAAGLPGPVPAGSPGAGPAGWAGTTSADRPGAGADGWVDSIPAGGTVRSPGHGSAGGSQSGPRSRPDAVLADRSGPGAGGYPVTGGSGGGADRSRAGDPDRSGISDPDRSGVSDPKRSGVSDPDRNGVGGPDRSRAGDPVQGRADAPDQGRSAGPEGGRWDSHPTGSPAAGPATSLDGGLPRMRNGDATGGPGSAPGRGMAPQGRWSDDGSREHRPEDTTAGTGGDPLGRDRANTAGGSSLNLATPGTTGGGSPGPATAGTAGGSEPHPATADPTGGSDPHPATAGPTRGSGLGLAAAGGAAPGHPAYPAKARRTGYPAQPPVLVPHPAQVMAQVHPAQLQMALLPRPAQLPVGSVRLAGRARETARITAISNRGRRNGRAPILISGAIGTGKSAVAMHWCHRSAPQFPDGVLYADLAEEGGDAAADVLAGFLLALGTPPGQIPVNPAHRAALYRSVLADRRMLVLLDNARDEAQVRLLLATAPRSQVLVTSRSRMAGLDGVERVVLEAMPPEQSIALLGAIVGHDQVAAHLKAALEVAALCDHLPVALRTVGTRIAVRRGWTLPQAAGQLRDERRRVDCLTAGRPGLRESFRLAHRGLDADSRRMLMRVARLHQVEFDASVPAAVTKLPLAQAEEALETLVDTGLLQTAATSGSYRLPVLFRLLSLEMLRSASPVAAGAVSAAG